MSPAVLALLALTTAPMQLVAASDNGMDMSMDGAMDLASGNMLMYLHFTPGAVLWFQGWVPMSAGAMVGTCIGLFLLGIVSRWIAACRGLMEAHWRKQALIIYANKMNTQRRPLETRPDSSSSNVSKGGEAESASGVPDLNKGAGVAGVGMRSAVPFIPAHDITRGVMHAGQAALDFAFMLAVMTFQVGFIAAIVVGLGVGETLFGRYSMNAHIH
ncbi:Ctr copper transporter family-domain-containing protein [Phellopilus nigrolimitatus]|nr:Ctr copper transporter family-domain-containing protein [Phellopilus nigrolimitatus]